MHLFACIVVAVADSVLSCHIKKVNTVLIAEFASVVNFGHFRSCNEITLSKSDTVQLTDKDIFPPLPGLFKLFGYFLNISQSLQFVRGEKTEIICRGG